VVGSALHERYTSGPMRFDVVIEGGATPTEKVVELRPA
jgi:hypothetical protein